VTKGGGPLVHGPTAINPVVGRPWAALQALNVVIGLFSSLAVNMPDFARFSKSTKASASQTLLLPVIGTLGALSPIFVTSAYKEIWGGENALLCLGIQLNYGDFGRVSVVPSGCHWFISFATRQILRGFRHVNRDPW
jgi:cytosine/uracil/thiamine/allantoin permease